jgi:hypothetical protein
MVLELKDIYFGEPDAKYEIISGSKEDVDRFFNSFVVKTNLQIEDFLNGRMIYILGLKGTGKTALLRYISLEAEKKGFLTDFVLFKSTFDKQDKRDFAHAARVINTDFFDENNDNFYSSEEDYSLVWRWFLYKEIVYTIEKSDENLIFEDDANWKNFTRLVKIVDPSEYSDRKFPTLKKGTVHINIGIFDKIGIGLDLEFENQKEKTIRFSFIVKRIDNAFKKLNVLSYARKMYILLDELEISYSTKKEFERDCKIISGLIIASKQIYNTCLEKKFPTKFICGIRTEVVHSIQLSGHELNKEIEGFGVNINWHQSGGSFITHPLTELIIKRLQSAEKEQGLSTDENIIFQKYFEKTIQKIETEHYIINQTWERPRDIVRLLSLAKKCSPSKTKFTHDIFDTIRKEYANMSWVEMVEELRAKYDTYSVEAIKQILTNIVNPFSLKEIESECIRKRSLYPDSVPSLLDKYDIKTILHDLYRIGIVGNYKGYRFAYKGNADLVLSEPIIIHRALWNFFDAKRNDNYIRIQKY